MKNDVLVQSIFICIIMQGISSVASRNNPVKYVDPDGEKMGMPENLTKEMQNRLSCTHAMPTSVKNILENRRSNEWGIYSIKRGTVFIIHGRYR